MRTKQITDTIFMVRPVAFRTNEQTKVNNYFQEELAILNSEINLKAQEEFDVFVEKLRSVGIKVIITSDDKKMDTPDSIFPNNWMSTHANGDFVIYPMYAENRRKERREEVLDLIESEGFRINNVIDYTEAENEGYFLEGTGSIVLDRVNGKAYCALSARADEELFIEFCEDFDYFPIVFTANQTVEDKRLAIYHTNVMMAMAEHFCVIALTTIDDKKERKNLINHLKESGKEIIAISEEQMNQFAGNMLQLKNKDGDTFMVMSLAAYKSLNPNQIKSIEKDCTIIHSDLSIIETCGGGSARCMMAEVFLPINEN